MAEQTFAPPTAEQVAPLNALLEQALTFAVGGMAPWTEAIGHENVRAVVRNGRLAAGMGIIPFGHWIGGRVVPSAGITAVGVAPDQRGGGVGLWMLQQALREQRERGVPIATLYPATTAFYRRNGFERAAHRVVYELPLAGLGVRAGDLEAEPFGPESYDVVKSLYARRAALASGFVDRPDFYWHNVLEPKEKPNYRFLVTRNGEPEGYVVFSHATWGETLQVRDIVALSPEAGRRLLGILAAHRSMLETMRMLGGPGDPILMLLAEQNPKVFRTLDLMLRVLDVPAALTARGYLPGTNGELHLDITDDVLPENSGRFVLRVEDGEASVTPGGEGRMRMHIRDLAALYTGYATAAERQLAGELRAEPADLATAARIFAGPYPWLPDMF